MVSDRKHIKAGELKTLELFILLGDENRVYLCPEAIIPPGNFLGKLKVDKVEICSCYIGEPLVFKYFPSKGGPYEFNSCETLVTKIEEDVFRKKK